MKEGIFGLSRWGRPEVEILVAIAVVWLTTVWLLRMIGSRRGQKYRLPPGPRGWPLVGAIPYLGKFPHESFLEMSKKYGPIMYMRLGAVPVLVISNAEMAKEVFQTHDQDLSGRPPLLVTKYISYDFKSVVWSSGTHWRQVRKIATVQLLANSKREFFTDILKNEILRTIHTVLEESQSTDVDISSRLSGTSMNIITQMMWNKRYRNLSVQESDGVDEKFVHIVETVASLAGADNIADFLPSYLQSIAMKLSGIGGKMEAIQRDFDEFLETIIAENEQALSNGTVATAAADEDNFVNVLLKLMREPAESSGLSRDTVKALLEDMITVGTESSSTVMTWVLADLMKYPEVMKKLQDELAAVIGDGRLVSESDIPNLKYVDAVAKEVLRKHSIVPLGVPHLSLTDCRIAGYDVPANTMVFISQFAIHHDSSVWENPNVFNPDRFLESELDYRGRHYDYLPFGSGRRICPGIYLASTFLHLAIAQFVHAVEWSLPEGQMPESVDMSANYGITSTKATPLFVRAKPRLAHDVLYPTMHE